jgi:hypothetical protein
VTSYKFKVGMTKGALWTAGFLASICLVSVWFALREYTEIQHLEQAKGITESHAQAEIHRLQREVASYRNDLGDHARKVIYPADDAQSKPANARGSVDLMPYLVKDPQFEELRRRRMLQQVHNMYGDLKSFSLTDEQRDKLTVLLANKINAPMDAREAALSQGMTDGTSEMGQAFHDTMKAADDEIKALVGDSGFLDLASASKQISSRNMVNASLGREFIASGQPLTSDQVNALADVQGHFQGTSEELDQAMRDRAAQVLTPSQMDVFLQNRSIDRDTRELQKRATEAATKETGTTSFHWGSW